MKKVISILIALAIILSVALPLSVVLSFADNNEPVIFYDCDSLSATELYGGSVSSTVLGNHNGNNDCLITDISGKNSHELGIILSDCVDASSTLYLEFDYYISSMDLTAGIIDSQIELSSDRNNDIAEIHWNTAALNEQNLTTGWNHIKFALDSNTGADGVFNKGTILRFRHYIAFDRTVNGSIGYDNIQFTFEDGGCDVETQTVTAVWTSCDSSENNGGWWFNPDRNEALNYENRNGENDVVANTVNNTAISVAYRNMNGLDISKMEYMEFDLYVSKADLFSAAIGDAQLEITSCDWVDNYEIHYNKASLAGLTLTNGWNHIKISLSDFVSGSDTVFDATSLKFMRLYVIYSDTLTDLTVKFDNVYFSKEVIVPVTPTVTDTIDWSGKNGWWFNPSDTTDLSRENYKAENDAVVMSANGKALVAAYRTESVDISEMGYIEFQLYLSEPDIIKSALGGELELTSSNWCDSQEINLSLNDLKALEWQKGWNHIKIAIDDFTALDGLFNKTSLNFMRFFLEYDTVSERKVMISGVVFTKADDKPQTEEIRDNTAGYITGCDSRVGWLTNSGTQITSDTEDKKQGTASLKFASIGNKGVEMRYTFDSIAFEEVKYLEFDLYISDASVLNDAVDMQVELSSSGKPDLNEINWNLAFIKGLELKNGWNSVKLPFIGASATGGDINLSKVCYFRLYCVFADEEEFVWKIDGLKPTADESDSKSFLSLDCDTVSGWQASEGVAISRDTVDKKQGNASVRFDAKDKGMVISAAFSGVNIKGANAIQFHLKINDAFLLELATEMQFEITSSGEPDKNELHWGKDILVNRISNDGWNLVTLFFDEAVESEDKFNYENFNFLRFYFINTTTEKYVINIDDVKFLKIEDVDSVKNKYKKVLKPIENVLTLSECDSLIGWSTGENSFITLDRENKVSGKSSISIDSPKGVLCRYTFDSVDASFANWLEFDLYIPTLSILNTFDMQVELSSNFDDDDAEIYWDRDDFLKLDLKKGWNRIRLCFDDANNSQVLSHEFDASEICCFRFYISSEEAISIKLDNLCVTAAEKSIEIATVTAEEMKEKTFSKDKATDVLKDEAKTIPMIWIIIPAVVLVVGIAILTTVIILRKKKGGK